MDPTVTTYRSKRPIYFGEPPYSLVKDAREDHLWFLRKLSGPFGREPGGDLYGIVDLEDVQPLSLKTYFLAYLADDPERAVGRQMLLTPEVKRRAQRYLDHLEIRRILALDDPRRRAEKL